MVASGLVRAYRWHLLFLGESTGVLRLFLIENAGIAFNSFLPIRVGAEVVQYAFLTRRYNRPSELVLATLALVRTVDLAVTIGIVLYGFLLVRRDASPLQYLGAGLGVTVLVVGSVLALWLVMERWSWLARHGLVRAYTGALRGLVARPRRLFSILAITLFHWVLLGLSAWLVAWGLGTGINPLTALVITLVVFFVGTTLPGLPGAIGPFELAAVSVMEFYEISAEIAFGFALLSHAVLFLPVIVIGAVTFVAWGVPWQAKERQPS